MEKVVDFTDNRHPDDIGFKMTTNYSYDQKAPTPSVIPRSAHSTTLSVRRRWRVIQGVDKKAVIMLYNGDHFRIIHTGLDYSQADQIDSIIDAIWM